MIGLRFGSARDAAAIIFVLVVLAIAVVLLALPCPSGALPSEQSKGIWSVQAEARSIDATHATCVFSVIYNTYTVDPYRTKAQSNTFYMRGGSTYWSACMSTTLPAAAATCDSATFRLLSITTDLLFNIPAITTRTTYNTGGTFSISVIAPKGWQVAQPYPVPKRDGVDCASAQGVLTVDAQGVGTVMWVCPEFHMETPDYLPPGLPDDAVTDDIGLSPGGFPGAHRVDLVVTYQKTP